MKEEHIRDGVTRQEGALAGEIINSFISIYPNVARIVDGLIKSPMVFEARTLAKFAPRSANAWPNKTYSQDNFLSLVSELGIVGRVERDHGGVIEATFEYSLPSRLRLSIDDECVIHPMYNSTLRVEKNREVTILPFATSDI
jgi:hypothetical protein